MVTDIIEFTDKQLVPWGMDFYTYVDAKEKKAQAWINKARYLDVFTSCFVSQCTVL